MPEAANTRQSNLPAKANAASRDADKCEQPVQPAREVGGPKGLEPTRYGDWEKNGRCYDF